MEGLKDNHAVRGHQLVFDALMRFVWKGFLPWLEDNHTEDVPHLVETLNVIGNFQTCVSQMFF